MVKGFILALLLLVVVVAAAESQADRQAGAEMPTPDSQLTPRQEDMMKWFVREVRR